VEKITGVEVRMGPEVQQVLIQLISIKSQYVV